MRNLTPIGLGIAGTAACYFLFEWSQTNGIIGFYRDHLSATMFAYWFAGFATAMIAPAACAVFFWLLAKRSRFGWVLHIALVPTIYAVIRACAALMLFAADEPDLDSLTGHALVRAILLMTICPLVYFGVLGWQKVREILQPEDDH